MRTETNSRPKSARRWELRLSYAGFALALFVFAFGAWDSPLIDRARRSQVEFLSRFAQTGQLDEGREAELAASYWSQYSDVAADSFFGREGRLGVWGAREHYKRHGKREGRVWPWTEKTRP